MMRSAGILSESLWDLARLFRKRGGETEASRIDQERISLWKNRPAEELVKLATQQAGRANLIGYGKTPLPASGEGARKLDREQAAASLELALTKDFTDFSRLRANPDLSPLLDRQDLKQVIEGRNLQRTRRPQITRTGGFRGLDPPGRLPRGSARTGPDSTSNGMSVSRITLS